MKYILFKYQIIALAFCLAASCNWSCTKDPSSNNLKNCILGKWDITSYFVDGVEEIGHNFETVELEFKSETDCKWRYVLQNLVSATASATYEVNGLNITFTIGAMPPFTYVATCDNGTLKMSGYNDGKLIEITAKKL